MTGGEKQQFEKLRGRKKAISRLHDSGEKALKYNDTKGFKMQGMKSQELKTNKQTKPKNHKHKKNPQSPKPLLI